MVAWGGETDQKYAAARDGLKELMSPEQIQEGQNQSREWHKRIRDGSEIIIPQPN